MIVVSDTSPISALLVVGQAHLLEKLFGEVFIPPAVADELSVSFSALPEFLHIRAPQDAAAVETLRRVLDRGEAQAIVLAREVHADLLLIDERPGRTIARKEGLTFTGVLGVLTRAKQERLIKRIEPIINRLVSEAGFYVAAEIIHDALRMAGEK